MKIYFGKAMNGKTSEMIKDFVKQEKSLFISDEMTGKAFMQRFNILGFDISILSSNNFLHKSINTIEDLKNTLDEYRGFIRIYADLLYFASSVPLRDIKQIEKDYNIELNFSYQKGLNALNNGIEVVEI
jgi:hypothetical protein